MEEPLCTVQIVIAFGVVTAVGDLIFMGNFFAMIPLVGIIMTKHSHRKGFFRVHASRIGMCFADQSVTERCEEMFEFQRFQVLQDGADGWIERGFFS